MSYEQISSTTPKSRKPHRCMWCGESIQVGEVHNRETGTYYGEFQDNRFHSECFGPMQEHCQENDGEFFPYENERPTKEAKP